MESTTIAFLAHWFFSMPVEVGYCLGYSMAIVSGSMIVPAMLEFRKKGLGMAKRIPSVMIVASNFENIEGIIAYGIAFEIAMNNAEDKFTG